VIDQQRRLEVCERDRVGTRESGVEIGQLESLALFQRGGERHLHVAPPFGPRLRFFPHRNALGEPTGHALIGHLQRDDVRELVPQRGLPRELAWWSRLRRIERDHAAEAGAERADHAGQPEIAYREVIVYRKDLDENRPLRRELVLRAEHLQRVARQRQRVLPQHRCLVGMHLDGHVAVFDLREAVELIEQHQQVVGHAVETVRVEGLLECGSRRGFIARSQEVHPEVAERLRGRGVECCCLLRQDDRFVEPVIACGQIGGNAVDLAETRMDRQHVADFLVVRLAIPLHVSHRGDKRARVEIARIFGQHLRQPLACGVGARVVEIQLRKEQFRGVECRIDLERLGTCRGGGGRIYVRHRPADPGVGRRPLRISLDHQLESPLCLGFVEAIKKQQSEVGVDGWVALQRRRCRSEQRVRIVWKSEGLRSTGRTGDCERVRRAGPLAEHGG